MRGHTYRAVSPGQYQSFIAVTDLETAGDGRIVSITAVEVLFREGLVPSICTVTLSEMEAASYLEVPFKVYDQALIEAYTILRERIANAVRIASTVKEGSA